MADEEIKRLEDRILENMLALDDINASITAAEAGSKDAERSVTDSEADDSRRSGGAPKARSRRLRASVRRWSPGSRRALTPSSTPCRAAARARRWRRWSGGLCSVCHVRVRPQIDQDVRRRDEIVQCESCTRILYHPAAAPAGPARLITAASMAAAPISRAGDVGSAENGTSLRWTKHGRRAQRRAYRITRSIPAGACPDECYQPAGGAPSRRYE